MALSESSISPLISLPTLLPCSRVARIFRDASFYPLFFLITTAYSLSSFG
jgi:hypothetical protein